MIANRYLDQDTAAAPARGTICFDDECRLCQRFVRRLGPELSRHGYEFAALQEAEIQDRLGLPAGRIADEVKLIAADGRISGGADALVTAVAELEWGWLLPIVARVPGAMALLRLAYRAVAAHRHCHDHDGVCAVPGQAPRQGHGRRWFAGHGRRRLGEGMMASLMLAVVNDLTRHRVDANERGYP